VSRLDRSDQALNAAVETLTRTELQQRARQVSANFRELSERIYRECAALDRVGSGEATATYADIAADMQREVAVTLYNSPLHVLTQLVCQADTARALATREDDPS
jgi:hypothetical protein